MFHSSYIKNPISFSEALGFLRAKLMPKRDVLGFIGCSRVYLVE